MIFKKYLQKQIQKSINWIARNNHLINKKCTTEIEDKEEAAEKRPCATEVEDKEETMPWWISWTP